MKTWVHRHAEPFPNLRGVTLRGCEEARQAGCQHHTPAAGAKSFGQMTGQESSREPTGPWTFVRNADDPPRATRRAIRSFYAQMDWFRRHWVTFH